MKAMIAHSSVCGEQIAAAKPDLLFANTCRHYHSPFIGRSIPADLPKLLYLQEPNRALYEADPELPWTGLAARRARSPQAKLRAAWDMAATRKLAREEHDNASAFDTILVNSRYSHESVRRAYGLNSTTCYLGVDTEKFHPSGKPEERYYLSVGALVPSKDPLLAVQAVAESGPKPLPLHWIAPYVNQDFKQSMTSLADRLGVTLHIHELVDDEGLVQAYQGATAVVYVPRLEPFGYVSIEAAACGIPVVGVCEGGLRETVLDGVTGFLHERDAKALGESLAKIAENSGLRASLGEAARLDALTRWQLPHAIDRLEAHLQHAVRK
jgi:glycosyltransferase involved in cell wall biosynthesis